MSSTSRAVVLEEFRKPLQVSEFPVPNPEPDAAVVRIVFGGVCGTDVHLHEGNLPIPLPLVLGHEAVGRVAALGSGLCRDTLGQPLDVGDMVIWASSIPCGTCQWCRIENEPTLCEQRKIYGINQKADTWPHLSGGWAEYIYLQPGSAIIRLPEGVRPEQAIALGCAGPTVVHGLERVGGIRVDDVVVVLGSGPVGMAAAMYSHLAGAEIVLMLGGPRLRLDIAEKLGVGDAHVDIFEVPQSDHRLARIMSETNGRGADLVIECTGVPSAVAEAMAMCRTNGRVLVLGQYTDRGDAEINPHLITKKQLRITGSWAFAQSHYVQYVESLPGLLRRFPLEELVSRYPLAGANEALRDVKEGRVMKAILG